jgi:phosphatidylglycerophosphate synthase
MGAPFSDREGPNLTDSSLFAEDRQSGSTAGLTEGELWSRELLDRLRAERFTGPAWRRFFGDGFRRSRVIRARRPELLRQSRRWGATGLVAALPFGPRAAAWWALWWAMIDWHLGMLETAEGRERPLSAADALTLTRLWAAPVVRRHPEPWLVAAGMATDLLDGALARRAGPTRLGRDFDSTADTLFLDAALRGATERHGLDPRLLDLERARLLVGSVVTLGSYFGESEPAPTQQNRGLAAVLAAAGALLAVLGRTRAAEPLIGAAIGYRTLIRVRAS